MTTSTSDLTRALGAVIDGVENDTALVALGALMTKQIVNNSQSPTDAHNTAQRMANFLISSIYDAFDILDAKERRP